MNKVSLTIVRSLLGLIFTVFGLNGFLHFLPMPPQSGVLAEMFSTYSNMGYMFPLIFTTQVVGGVLLLTNFFAPLALVLLAPVIVNIVLLHIFLDPHGLPPAILVLLCELYLAYRYRDRYAPLFKAK